MNQEGITVVGSFLWSDGYGRVTSQLALGMLERGWDVYIRDINEKEVTEKYAHPLIRKHYDALNNYSNTAFQLSHYPPNILPFRVSSKTLHTFFCTFETTQPPIYWKERLERTTHQMITTSEWARQVFLDAFDLQMPIHVIPHGIDTEPYDLRQWKQSMPFRFLLVGANPLDGRKNGMAAVSAFRNAFPPNKFGPDDVQLWIKGFQTPPNHFDDSRIIYMRGDFNTQAMRELYRSCHILVSPSRGEGFGLPIFEGMAHGLIPMVTDWSTPGELLSEQEAFKIPVKRLIPMERTDPGNPYDPAIFGWYEQLGFWAEPRFDAMVGIMQGAFESRDQLVPKATLAYEKAKSMPVSEMVERTIQVVTGDSRLSESADSNSGTP